MVIGGPSSCENFENLTDEKLKFQLRFEKTIYVGDNHFFTNI